MTWPTGSVNCQKIGLQALSSSGSNSSHMKKLDGNFTDFLKLLNSHEVEYRVAMG